MGKYTLKVCGYCGKMRPGRGRDFCSIPCSNKSRARDKLKLATEPFNMSFREELEPVAPHLNVEADICFVIGDAHIPFHNRTWLKRLMLLGSKRKAENPDKIIKLVINGDLLNADFIGRHGQTQDNSFKRALKDCAHLMDSLICVFDEIIWTCGNHEDRFARVMDRLLGFSELGKMVKNRQVNGKWDDIKLSGHNFSIINDTWMAVHPQNYSKVQTRVATNYAKRWKINTICNHEHHPFGFARTECGDYFGVMCGMICDPRFMGYKTGVRNLFPEWENGFVELEKYNNQTHFTGYDDKNTIWERVLQGVEWPTTK